MFYMSENQRNELVEGGHRRLLSTEIFPLWEHDSEWRRHPKRVPIRERRLACGNIYVGIQICTEYSFFVKPHTRQTTGKQKIIRDATLIFSLGVGSSSRTGVSRVRKLVGTYGTLGTILNSAKRIFFL